MSLKDKMMDYLQSDRKRSHYIPEFDETVYFTPITVIEMEKLMTLSGGGADNRSFHIFTVIEKIEDAGGKKIFDITDRPYIEKLPWKLVTGITGAIHGLEKVEDLKKTSKQTATEETSSPSPSENAASSGS